MSCAIAHREVLATGFGVHSRTLVIRSKRSTGDLQQQPQPAALSNSMLGLAEPVKILDSVVRLLSLREKLLCESILDCAVSMMQIWSRLVTAVEA